MSRRASVITTAADAVAQMEPGVTIGFGGVINSTHAMPIVREIIRQGIGDLHVVGLASGLEVDMLISAGLVSRLTTPTVSAETVQMIAPGFRKAAQDGSLKITEIDEGMIYAALQAASQMVPFAPFPGGMGGSYAELNEGMIEIEAPFGGQRLLAIRAQSVDFAFVHASRSDPYGNVQVIGGGLGDRALARASDRVFATVERIVGNHEIRRNPETTAIPGAHGVIHAPFGSHPFASPGHYIHDVEHMREYLAAADQWLRQDDRSGLDEYFETYVHDAPTHWDYLERLGPRRLYGLEEALHYDIEEPAVAEEVGR
jgi:glutaconate CoA-transferase subunit A